MQPGTAGAIRPRIVVESRYGPDPQSTDSVDAQIMRNVRFACHACHFVIMSGGNPIASHLFYTQFLSEERERDLGITLGYQWGMLADEVWFFLREGQTMSRGMIAAAVYYSQRRKRIRFFRTADGGVSFYETLTYPEILDGSLEDEAARQYFFAQDREDLKLPQARASKEFGEEPEVEETEAANGPGDSTGFVDPRPDSIRPRTGPVGTDPTDPPVSRH